MFGFSCNQVITDLLIPKIELAAFLPAQLQVGDRHLFQPYSHKSQPSSRIRQLTYRLNEG